MTDRSAVSRRALARAALAGIALLRAWPSLGQAPPSDRGIGGTGVVPPGPAGLPDPAGGGDRGIGGTGVVGTIRGFGSIWVNGLRITYPADVPVTIDGVSASAADLKIGHVVAAVARPGGGALATDRIAAASEVIGPIESRTADSLTVLGQAVSLAEVADDSRFRPGTVVAVSGLRRPDGAIVASLIEERPGATARVAGPARRAPDGTVTIGKLRLDGLDPALVGRRAVVTGTLDGTALRVGSAARSGPPIDPGIRRLSLESYVERVGTGLRSGAGYEIAGAARLPGTGPVRAVLTAQVDPQGRLRIERLQPESSSPGGPVRSGPDRDRTTARPPDRSGMPGGGTAQPGGVGSGPGGGGGPGSRGGGPGPGDDGQRQRPVDMRGGPGGPGGGLGGPGGGFGVGPGGGPGPRR